MILRALTSEMTDRVAFRLNHLRFVPEESGCYALASIDEIVLYVGKTTNLHRRLEDHLSDPEKTGITPSGRAVWFYYGFWPEERIEHVEMQLLRDHKMVEGVWPILNKTGP
ncbi:MAG: GIY-YIG nuclease family protein [Dehalococcoidia bacterium]|nr:GIY-YIG nuclease family protein [Dehalococcoidia bacterium]